MPDSVMRPNLPIHNHSRSARGWRARIRRWRSRAWAVLRPNGSAARAHVDQKQDQGRVAASLEVPAGAGLQQPAEGILAHQRNGLIWHGGRAHLRHRTNRDLSLGLQPAVEHAQAPVAVGGRGGLPAGELVGDERLDVLAPRLLQLDASGSEELSGQPKCVEVRLDGAALFSARRCSSKERTRSATLGSAMTGRHHEPRSSQMLLKRCAGNWCNHRKQNPQVRP
jgi:hypothetical protein